jgi:carboxymethylenebutenolidase
MSSGPLDQPAITYVARPQGAVAGKVLVLHAWWGLNDFIRRLCDRLAEQGFLAAAPDLYEGDVATTPEQAEAMRDKQRREPAEQRVLRAAMALVAEAPHDGRSIGVLGLSLGAYFAMELAQRPDLPLAATVIFYDARGGDYAKSRSAFQGHYAETDPFVSDEERAGLAHDLAAAGKVPDFHVYPGTGHWFFETDRPEAYDETAAELAWRRVLAFLREHLSSQ